MLLFWGTLEPQNGSDIAAVRFNNAVSINALAIYPNGSFPFLNDEDAVALTEPSSFELELLFHTQHVARHPEDVKPKQTNALIRSTLAYTGGQREFPIPWDPEIVTRMMILRGEFKTLSIAIYGSIYSSSGHSPFQSTSQTVLGNIIADNLPLSSALDLTSSFDPTHIARQLLSLIPRAPPLTTVLRLILCIKPRKEDWDDPGFPLYERIDGSLPESLDELLEVLSKPIEASSDGCRSLSRAISSILIQKKADPTDVARVFSLLACQSPELVDCVKEELPPLKLELDGEALNVLAAAIVHPALSGYLESCEIQALKVNLETFKKGLLKRALFNLALSSERDDMDESTYSDFTSWQDSILTSERVLGTFILSFLETNSTENSGPLNTPKVADNKLIIRTHKDLVACNRLLVGISSVFAVLGWSDSVGDERAIERVLAVLRIWQSIESYSIIVNKLLSLPQYTVRLERFLQPDQATVPSTRLIAEQILHSLITESPPSILLNEDVSYTVLSLRSPMLGFDDEVRELLVCQAELADGGLDAAIDFLGSLNERTMSFNTLLQTRLSLIFIQGEVQNSLPGMNVKLSGVLASFSKLLSIFAQVNPNSGSPEGLLSDEIVDLALQLLPFLMRSGQLKSTDIRFLTRSLFRHATRTDKSADRRRWNYLSSALSELSVSARDCWSPKGLAIILRTLIEEGISIHGHGNPVNRVNAAIELVQLALISTPSVELTEILLPSLDLFEILWCSLNVSQKIACTKSLNKLDSDGLLGLIEWLITAELGSIERVISMLSRCENEASSSLLRAQCDAGFDFLNILLTENLVELNYLLSSESGLGDRLKPLLFQIRNYGIISQSTSRLAVRISQSPGLDFHHEVTRLLLMNAGVLTEFLPVALENVCQLIEDGVQGEAFLEDVQRCAKTISQMPADGISRSPGVRALTSKFTGLEEQRALGAASDLLSWLRGLLDQQKKHVVSVSGLAYSSDTDKKVDVILSTRDLDSIFSTRVGHISVSQG